VVVNGTIDKSGDHDEGYTVEALLPWKAFAKSTKVPPEIGSRWRVNFYAMQNNGGVAWSPILKQGNFHKASRFGEILWAEQGWMAPDMVERMKAMGQRPGLMRPVSPRPGQSPETVRITRPNAPPPPNAPPQHASPAKRP
jgi:hypothetical protein